MRQRFLLLIALVLPLSLAFACNNGGDNDEDPTPALTPAAGTGIDEDYLKAICVGTSNFSNALMSATSVDEIRTVVEEFADEMRGLNPPADLTEYNIAFVAYLDAAAVADPTSLVTTAPPEPPEDVRRRMALLEPTIDECRDPTFFSRDEDETPTP
jgi:hypothetical protein